MDTAKILGLVDNPITLIGLAVLMFFFVLRTLVRGGMLSKLSTRSSSEFIRVFLRYGFVISIIVILLGFALEFYRAHLSERNIDLSKKINIGPFNVKKTTDDGTIRIADETHEDYAFCEYYVETFQVSGHPVASVQGELNDALYAIDKNRCDFLYEEIYCFNPYVGRHIFSVGCLRSTVGFGAAVANRQFRTYVVNLQTLAAYDFRELFNEQRFCKALMAWLEKTAEVDESHDELLNWEQTPKETERSVAEAVLDHFSSNACNASEFEDFFFTKQLLVLPMDKYQWGLSGGLGAQALEIPLDDLREAKYANSNAWAPS